MTRTGGENEFVITGLETNTLYTIRITALTNNGQNRGMESVPGTGMTGAGGRKAYPSPPPPPYTLSVSYSACSITLSSLPALLSIPTY